MRKTFTYLTMMAALLIPALASAETVQLDVLDYYESGTEPAKGVVEELHFMSFYADGYWMNNEACDGVVTVTNQDNEVVFSIPAGSALSQCTPWGHKENEMDESVMRWDTSIALYFVTGTSDDDLDEYFHFPKGTYTITFPEGFYKEKDTDNVSAELVFTNWYTVNTVTKIQLYEAFGEEYDQLTEPVPGKIEDVEEFDRMCFLAKGMWNKNEASDALMTVKNQDGVVVFSADSSSPLVGINVMPVDIDPTEDEATGYNSLMGVYFVTLADPNDPETTAPMTWEDGIYTIDFPEGFFVNEAGELSAQLLFADWYIVGDVEPVVPEVKKVELTYSNPVNGGSIIGPVETVNLYFNTEMRAKDTDGYLYGDLIPNGYGARQEYHYTVTVDPDYKNSVTLTFETPLKKGEYMTSYYVNGMDWGCSLKSILAPEDSEYQFDTIDFTFTVAEYLTFPEDGKTYSEPISRFQVDMGMDQQVELTLEEGFELRVSFTPTEGEEGIQVYTADDVNEWMLNWGSIEIEFPEAYSEAGIYMFTIPANSFQKDGVLVDYPIVVTITHNGFEAPEVVSVTPACGEVESLSTITIEFNKELAVNPDGWGNIQLWKGWDTCYDCSYELNGNQVTLTLLDEEGQSMTITDGGTWSLQNLLYVLAFADGTPVDSFYPDFTWTIPYSADQVVTYELFPAADSKVTEIAYVQITTSSPVEPAVEWEDSETGDIHYSTPMIKEYLGEVDPDDIWSYNYNELSVELLEGGTVIRHEYAEPITEECTLTYGFSWYNVASVEEKVLPEEPATWGVTYWTVHVSPETGVQLIGIASDVPMTVYDINGRVVLRGAKKVDIKSLQPGIYVANGMKFVVK